MTPETKMKNLIRIAVNSLACAGLRINCNTECPILKYCDSKVYTLTELRRYAKNRLIKELLNG